MDIGNKLKELRIQNKLTALAVASSVGVRQQQISKWEKNQTRPEYENLVKLAKLYDVTTDYLLGIEKD